MKNLIWLGCIILGVYLIAHAKFALAQMIPRQKDDAQVLGLIEAEDFNEIHLAQLAEQKNIDQPILAYAWGLERYQRKNLDDLRKLSSELGINHVSNNGQIVYMRRRGEQEIFNLAPLDQDDFSREFIWDMITGHSKVLSWIDSQDVHHAEVRKFLEETMRHITFQLKMAQQIREKVLR